MAKRQFELTAKQIQDGAKAINRRAAYTRLEGKQGDALVRELEGIIGADSRWPNIFQGQPEAAQAIWPAAFAAYDAGHEGLFDKVSAVMLTDSLARLMDGAAPDRDKVLNAREALSAGATSLPGRMSAKIDRAAVEVKAYMQRMTGPTQ